MLVGMRRPTTTVVAVVGPRADETLARLAGAANLSVLRAPDGSLAERVRWVAGHLGGVAVPYGLVDVDPLADVAEAWIATFDEQAPHGTIEVAVAAARRLLTGPEGWLPDYYLVAGADALGPTARHWYLGFLHHRAPGRVAVVDPDTVRAVLGSLPPARWWPAVDDLLADVGTVTPDRVGAPV